MKSASLGSQYPFDSAAPQADDRFANLAALYDDVTCRHLDRLGITGGWYCLEVGAGGGSIARRMGERVGRTGRVVATDINTDRMPGSLPVNVEIRQHDIGADPLPEAAFDLLHARAVLTFVPGRRLALARMAAALKPGGWLLVEEMVPPVTDAWAPLGEPDVELAKKARTAIVEVIRRRGGDPTFGLQVPSLMTEAGLTDVGAEGFFVPFRTDAVAGLSKANIDQIGDTIVEMGLMSSAELKRFRALLDRPNFPYPASMALISAWGRGRLE